LTRFVSPIILTQSDTKKPYIFLCSKQSSSMKKMNFAVGLVTWVFLGTFETGWAQGGFQMQLVALSGEVPVGRPSTLRHQGFEAPFVGRGGQLAFSNPVTYVGQGSSLGQNTYKGIYQGTPGAMQWANPDGPYPAPNRPNVVFLPITVRSVNTSGQTLCEASFATSPSGTFPTLSGNGLALGTGPTAQIIYLSGDPEPNVAGLTLTTPAQASDRFVNLSDSGRVTFLVNYSGTGADGTSGRGIYFTDSPGTLTRVAAVGMAAPGTGVNFSALYQPQTSDNGSIFFQAGTGSSTDITSLWVRRPNATLERIAGPGVSAPAGSGATFTTVGSTQPVAVRNDGTVAFYGDCSNGKSGFFETTTGGIQPIALTQDTVPGTGGGTWNFLNNPSLRTNDSGTAVFVGSWFRFSPTFGSESGLYARYQGNLVLIAGRSTPVPGAPANAQFNTFDPNDISLNNANQVIFRASLLNNNPATTGYWAADLAKGTLELVFLNGSTVETSPGVSQTATLEFLHANHTPRGGGSGLALSDTGRFAVRVMLADSRRAIYSTSFAPALTRLNQWRLAQYGSSENTGTAADTYRPGPDDLPILVRYAMGLTASQSASTLGRLPQTGFVELAGQNYPTFRFVHDSEATDVRLSVTLSSDLVNWVEGNIYQGGTPTPVNAHTVEIERITLPDGKSQITVRSQTPMDSGAPTSFFRLRATQ
jgi:hypothetical protein